MRWCARLVLKFVFCCLFVGDLFVCPFGLNKLVTIGLDTATTRVGHSAMILKTVSRHEMVRGLFWSVVECHGRAVKITKFKLWCF